MKGQTSEMNRKNHPIAPLTQVELDNLLAKYYDGLTSCLEERWISTYLKNYTDNPKYEADRAVQLFLAMRKKEATTEKNIQFIPRYKFKIIQVAAAITIICLLTHNLIFNSSDDLYVAYIYGEKYTDKNMVIYQMQQSIENITIDEVSPDKALGEMFDGVELNNNTKQ